MHKYNLENLFNFIKIVVRIFTLLLRGSAELPPSTESPHFHNRRSKRSSDLRTAYNPKNLNKIQTSFKSS
jgi:hypothetical protein